MTKLFLLFTICFSTYSFSQRKLAKLLKEENLGTIPYISVDSLKQIKNDVILLDSREEREFKVSHLRNAICVGYDFFNIDSLKQKVPDKKSNIIVYCSVGIRSEDIAEKLKNSGYTNVLNLYGGIFEWKNNDLEIVNSKEKLTDSVHTFSVEWSKWLKKGIRVYE
ncbi:hypothetical protein MHTCC0001_07380 [Flavobacteriaceae bacterium MHTCC 0001]